MNPLLEEWTTPFGVPPFARIRAEHFGPAFEAAVAEHRAEMEAIALPPLFERRYNIAPTQPVAAIQTGSPGTVAAIDWGFPIPKGSLVINARSETIREKPLFRDLLDTRRCLILSDGFYEWKEKQPYYFQLPDRALFGFAGLWRPKAASAKGAESECVIITRSAATTVKPIHERMPVILRPDEWNGWIEGFRIPDAPPELTARPVSPRVNKVANDDPSLIEQAPVQGDLF